MYADTQQANGFAQSLNAGLGNGDDRANFTIIIHDINSHGGILGHRIVPVWYEAHTNQDFQQIGEAACDDFTQDHHVSFVVPAGYPDLDSCVAQAGAASIGAGATELTGPDFAKFPYMFMPDTIALDRLAYLQAHEFYDMGFFGNTATAKVGILYTDTPFFTGPEKLLEGYLRQLHVDVVDRFAVHDVQSTDDAAEAIGDDQAAVLRFRSDGVNHVMGVEAGAWGLGFFALTAANQGYFPRYAIQSNESPTAMQAADPASALKNSLFIGWNPTQDVDDTRAFPAAAKRCLALIGKGKQPLVKEGQRQSALNDCEVLFFLRAALTKAGGITRDALKLGARELGSSYDPVATWAVDLPDGNGAGAAAIRRGAYLASCSCFAYTSPPISIG